MRKRRFLMVAAVAAAQGLFAVGDRAAVGVPRVRAAPAVPSSWQKSASFVPGDRHEFGSAAMRASLRQLRATGANYVTLVIPLYQGSRTGSVIGEGHNTPTDASLRSVVKYARSLGLSVAFKVHLEVRGHPQIWRGRIDPKNRKRWFKEYGDELVRYGRLGARAGVGLFVLGAELTRVTENSVRKDNGKRWISMIARVRKVFRGKLTYDTDWSRTPGTIGFWKKLDFIAISGYYPLSAAGSPAALRKAWARIDRSRIQPMWRRHHKKIVFGEIGYRSITGTHNDPPEFVKCGVYDEQAQVRAYEAVFSYWRTRPYFAGVHLWQWNIDAARGWRPTVGDFTAQDKAAEQTMTRWFGGRSKAAVIVDQPKPGQALPAADGLISARMPGRPAGSYSMTWQADGGRSNPMTADGANMTALVGFDDFTWRDDDRYRLTFTARDTSGKVIGRKNIDVYVAEVTAVHPAEGAALDRGVLSLKAGLGQASSCSYTMRWTVDGDTDNQWPMKALSSFDRFQQVDTDTTAWTWRGDGPYRIDLLATDLTGLPIGQRSVLVTLRP